uniref:Uncharacterized protein n=1 Tax=Globisporangium ultimum (strain ATCC 200006 / CBS 805.95 / DAOM BR144) TaxID=431595 RepID=K3WSW6_GLOUD
MTGSAQCSSMASPPSQEIDFFSLHNRKKKHIDVEMLDYGYVEKSTDIDELKGILAMLRSGKEGRYPHLERATEDRILALLPERERNRINRMRSEPSQNELVTEKDELLSWSEQMDAKHKALQNRNNLNRRLPPVRGQQQASPVVEPELKSRLITEINTNEAETEKSKPKKQAIPAYDFRAWEKYNVDQALDEIDAEDEKRKEEARKQRKTKEMREKERKKELASLPSYVDYDELSPEEREVHALHEKQKGNECFKVNENDEAILYYTRSMAFDDSNAIIYANRAMAYLRIKSFAAAEQDCSRAVLLDPTYVKGWTRRGMTRFRRGKYAEAIADFEEALRLEPSNKEVKKLLKKAMDKWKETDGTVQMQSSSSNGSNQDTHEQRGAADNTARATQINQGSHVVDQSPQTEQAEETKPFKRFEIIEESDAESDEDDDPQAQSNDDEDADDVDKSFQRFEIIEE